ncbi:FecR family protein [Roseateles sp.]|uniref:FecR family protein n=1 Tax=Roseateles sp. TaxID=1971397 RepID=UPI003BA54989
MKLGNFTVRALLPLVVFGAVAGAVQAAPATPPMSDTHVAYEVKRGDKLEALVARYMDGPDALDLIAKLNQVRNVSKLDVGRQLWFPRDRMRHEAVSARVTQLSCKQAQLILGESARALQEDDTLGQDSVLRIPAGCYASLAIQGGSKVGLPSGATVKLKVLRRNALEASPEVQIELLNGRVDLEVEKRGQKDAPFLVRTPTSVAGVRGTSFKVGFDEKSRQTQVEVQRGVVGARGLNENNELRVGAGQGLTISADGRSQAIETLPVLPRVLGLDALAAQWQVQWQRSDSVQRLHIERAAQANEAQWSAQDLPAEQPFVLTELGGYAVFFKLQAMTAGGLSSDRYDVALCKGIQRADEPGRPRCHVRFDLESLNEVHLRLTRQEGGSAVTVIDAPVQSRQAVVRGLLQGHYQWTLRAKREDGSPATWEGDFELIVGTVKE